MIDPLWILLPIVAVLPIVMIALVVELTGRVPERRTSKDDWRIARIIR